MPSTSPGQPGLGFLNGLTNGTLRLSIVAEQAGSVCGDVRYYTFSERH